MKQRPKISVYIAASLDGYIARSDDSLDWMDRVGGFDEDYGFSAFLNSVDAVIMGRKTYQIAAGSGQWPYVGKRVVVLSRTLDAVREGAEIYQGSISQLINELQSAGITHVWVDGGKTIAQFLSEQLVDRFTLSIIPFVLGSGIPLFNPLPRELTIKLISANSYPSGLVQLTYAFTDAS